MSILQRAADSILESDRRKVPEFGGGVFDRIASVEVEGGEDAPATLTLRTKDGTTALAPVMPQFANRPKDRPFAPADVHDAVLHAMKSANEELPQAPTLQ